MNQNNRKFLSNISQAKTFAVESRTSGLAILNLALVILAALLLFWYAFASNSVTSGRYQTGLLKTKLAGLQEENNSLLSQKSDLTDIGALLVFSHQAGLVEQKNIEYVFDRNNLAQVQSQGSLR